MGYNISGIQQIGLGNLSVYETWEWYRKHLGMDMPVFDEAAEAGLMLPYTDGKPQARHAVLALNYNGGGGMEIWQYTSRTAQPPKHELQFGDIGIAVAKFKARDVEQHYEYCKSAGLNVVSDLSFVNGVKHFFMKDPYGNLVEVAEGLDWFKTSGTNCGGILGATIGVSNMNVSVEFYKSLLGYDVVLSDTTDTYDDLVTIDGGTSRKYRRVLLTHNKTRTGPFAKLLGKTTIELVQALDRTPNNIFEGRLWGDLGYIHLCFDVQDMDDLKRNSTMIGHPYTVDSAESFDMGEAAGRFAYIEDPDGTLIEFVEAHKIPIMKKLGWYLDLTKRDQSQSLPNYFFKAMALSRKKSPVA